MSTKGELKAEKVMKGRVSRLEKVYIDAYSIAVKNGFKGTEEEWLESLKGENGYIRQDALILKDQITGAFYKISVENGKFVLEEGGVIEGDEGIVTGAPGEDGEDGGYYTPVFAQVDNDTIKVSFTPSKEDMPSIEDQTFDLPSGEPGEDGADGQSAYALAVQKGFVGSEEEWLESMKGADGKDGAAGQNGANGTSPVVTLVKENGVTSFTVTDVTGTQTVTINDGKDGIDATPVVPLFANSIEDCTDPTQMYVLPDGFIYANITKAEYIQTNEYNANTASFNARINSSYAEASRNGMLLLPMVEVDLVNPYIVKVTGVNLALNYSAYAFAIYYDANKSGIKNVAYDGSGKFEVYTDGHYEMNIYNAEYASAKYVRICLCLSSDTNTPITASDVSDLFVEFLPKSAAGEVTTGWQSTGHAFVPADYEADIVELKTKSDEYAAKIYNLEQKVMGNEEEETSVVVPEYWKPAVNNAIASVKAIQNEGGADIVNFMWFSDMHHSPNNAFTKNIGALCAAVMDACDIPLALMSGDTMSATAVSSEDILLEWLDSAEKVLSPIGADRLMQIRGNHDDVWGTYNGGTTVSYVNKVAPAKIWNKMHRNQAKDFRRVFGGDGTYFYLDNKPQKVRFICLNSQFYDGAAITGGTTGAMTNGFGEAQLAWLRDVALAVEDDWGVVIATHIPPTASPVNGNTYYLSQMEDGEAFRNIINATEANLLGIFCGHCHADATVPDDLPCPILTITCAINTPYDGTSADRVAGTAAETALDVVSINRATKAIYTTRLGVGSDRVTLPGSNSPHL